MKFYIEYTSGTGRFSPGKIANLYSERKAPLLLKSTSRPINTHEVLDYIFRLKGYTWTIKV